MYIGIDLGTSNSVIAGVDHGAAQVFRPADGGDVLPSVIYVDKRGHRLYGRRAYDQAMIAPENVASGFKRLMGTDTPIEVAGLTMTPEECSAEIIRQLIGQAITESGQEVFDGVVIAVPAAFNQMQSEATLRAAQIAGLNKVDLIQEPIAAAMASMVGAQRSGKFIIYDFGGGTFDAALVEAVQGEVRILAQRGVNMLGGRDFDRMIVGSVVRPWLLANFDLPENFLRDPQYKRLSRLAHLAAERAKIDLSTLEEASIFASDDEVRLLDVSETEIFLDVPITRAQFEELIRLPVQNTIDLISDMLADHALAPADIDRIVFVGGSSRIPLIRRQVTETLGIVADLKADPMTAVAEGAAYYCEGRQWNAGAAPLLAGESQPKEAGVQARMKDEPDLSFDYAARTPDEKVAILIRAADLSKKRHVRLMTTGWDSGLLVLKETLTINAPLPCVGENAFDVHVLDEDGAQMKDFIERLTVTRLVAAAATPATQTIAVKVRKAVNSDENSFLPLVEKGALLPAQGQIQVKSGTELRSGAPGFIGFELFQVEYPDRVDLNLCVGHLRIEGMDLPKGQIVHVGDPILFDWRISEGGVLHASVQLPSCGASLSAQRFYAPQAGQISYEGQNGTGFTKAVLLRAEEEWGDIVAAIGPMSGPDIALLKTRLDEQKEILDEAGDDSEAVRRVSEEARFIRQDMARLSRKYAGPLLQRNAGKLSAAFNRVVRGRAAPEDREAFDAMASRLQKIIDGQNEEAFDLGRACLDEMRRIFFSAAWKNPDYVTAWFERLKKEPWLFADQEEYAALVVEGEQLQKTNQQDALRDLTRRLLDARIMLSASDAVGELASITHA